jgi:hypothetical protein
MYTQEGSIVTAIVLHAGMPKAGSSSIQEWLQRNSADLRERGFTVLACRNEESEEIDFAPHVKGSVNTGWMVNGAVGMPAEFQQQRADDLVEGLASAAERYGNVVASGEAFSMLFWSLHPASLAGLQGLSTRYQVRVAYYARPQHTCLEALWRQVGYHSGERPSAYIERCAPQLDYASTREGVNARAPDVEFEPRPFRADLLHLGDIVSDFAMGFLGIDLPKTGEWANRGLPLEVANVLNAAPAGMFWDLSYRNERVKRIKRLLGDLRLPEDDRVALSRRVLNKYAFERFAAENAALGWEDFVPPPEDGDEIPGIEALDSLWAPQASPAELEVLFQALNAAIHA